MISVAEQRSVTYHQPKEWERKKIRLLKTPGAKFWHLFYFI
jgi:hypothetical protein